MVHFRNSSPGACRVEASRRGAHDSRRSVVGVPHRPDGEHVEREELEERPHPEPGLEVARNPSRHALSRERLDNEVLDRT